MIHRTWLHYRKWYRQRWLRGVSPNMDVTREQERLVAEEAFDEVWFSRWYPYYLVAVFGLSFGTTFGAVAIGIPLLLATAISSDIFDLAEAVAALVVGYGFGLPATLAWDLGLLPLLRMLCRRPVRVAMRTKGIETCVPCGYLLTGLEAHTTRCPECGSAREPMTEPAVEAGPDEPSAPGEEGPGRFAQ